MSWSLIVTIGFYTLGLLHSCVGFYKKRQIFVNFALGMVGTGFLFHSIFLLTLGLERRHFPIADLPESLSFFAWSITLTFIVANIRYRYNVLGAFVLPLVSLLMVLSEVAWERHHAIPPLLRSRWLYFHVSVAFLAYAGFVLMFIAALLYLIQEKELKAKRFRFLYFRLPALQACDELMRNSLFVGFIMMSLTIVTGAFWAQQAWGRFWSWDPKETASLITWSIYLLLVHYRLSGGWRARRAAYVSIAGFASMLVTFGVNAGLHAYL